MAPLDVQTLAEMHADGECICVCSVYPAFHDGMGTQS